MDTPMSDDITADAGEHTEQPAEETFKAPASQEELDRIIQARVARERKNIPTDYEELKAKAQKFAEWEEANKTEVQKTADRLAAAEKRATELEAKALRSEVAAAKGVPSALLTGSTQEELEAAADALIAFRGEQKPAGPSSSALGRINAGSDLGSDARSILGF
jgi:septal ring factor EnvC (AmiA/AmiB activator)